VIASAPMMHQSDADAHLMVEAHYHTNKQRLNLRKVVQEKRCWPHRRVHSLSRGGLRGRCQYPADWVPPRTGFKTRQRIMHALMHFHVPPQL
jgi:hypothetical protein